ncbi:MAG: hypothetical protein JJU28_04590 [Cyclobacteriaceae bacterium]|nr:hypothetical protein [Cyclobacteriaceae bacterium]
MQRWYFIGLVFLGFFCIAHNSFAQNQRPPLQTTNTKKKVTPNPKRQGPKGKKIRYIIKNDTKGTLHGNRCFENETLSMGFLYMAVPKGQAANKNEFERNLHNLGVKTALTFKNGPFWKIKERKAYKKCRETSGDIIGIYQASDNQIFL